MEKRILIPLDNTKVSREVVRLADAWGQHTGAELYFLHVDWPREYLYQTQEKDFQEHFIQFLKNCGIESTYHTIYKMGIPYLEIVEQATVLGVDLILMAAHDHSMLGRFFLGSTTDYVLHHVRCPVYVHKANSQGYAKKTIVPLDYSDVNQTLVRRADQWVQESGGELCFVHAAEFPEVPYYNMESGWDTPRYDQQTSTQKDEETTQESSKLEQQLREFVESLGVKSPFSFYLRFGKPYLKILEVQKETNAGLIMIAAHSHTLLDRLFMGSTSDYLVHHAHCPVYVYKEPPPKM